MHAQHKQKFQKANDALNFFSARRDRTFPSEITYAYGTRTVKMQLHLVELATVLVRDSN